MDQQSAEDSGTDLPRKEPFRIRLPGFVVEDIGLGEVIKRATAYIGLAPCGGCQRRAEALDRRVVISGRRRT